MESTTAGDAGGPIMVSTPGAPGMASPTRTNGWPPAFTMLGMSDPITSGYGTPVTELTIVHMAPAKASGIPFANGPPGGIMVITPVSGAIAIPGETTTLHPMVTGHPGISRILLSG
ncbi:MAG TPA: hypothetical protein VES88_12195 [Gemmatimonadaceae bacterium]|nr:hypothetical protein [Gemmatimonadaceae bacterium]